MEKMLCFHGNQVEIDLCLISSELGGYQKKIPPQFLMCVILWTSRNV